MNKYRNLHTLFSEGYLVIGRVYLTANFRLRDFACAGLSLVVWAESHEAFSDMLFLPFAPPIHRTTISRLKLKTPSWVLLGP